MERISGSTAVADMFGTGKDGFTEGSPGVTAPTIVKADWLNAVQEEIANAVEDSGIALDANNRSQLYQAMKMMRIEAALKNLTKLTPAGAITSYLTTVLWSSTASSYNVVIAGESGAIQTSGDGGQTWTSRTAAGSYTGAFNAGFDLGDPVVLVGTNGEIQTSSDNGVTWTARTAAASFTGTFTAVCANFSTGRIVAVGSGGMIQTSDDYGVTWTQRTAAGSFSGFFNGVCWCNPFGIYVAVGAGGEIQTSPDGTTWTQRTAGGSYTGTFRSVASNILHNTPIIAVGEDPTAGTNGEIQSSTDGITWTSAQFAGEGKPQFVSAPYRIEDDNPAIYIIAMYNAVRAFGLDGIAWKNCTVSLDGALPRLRCVSMTTDGQIFFVGDSGGIYRALSI